MSAPSPTRRHLLILTAICAVAYFVGLTTQGVGAWHEGQRVLVARQMLAAGEWIVPTINGHPYLAKPPLFYWAQMALATVRGSQVNLLDARLTVAIFGWLGVLVTYLAARDMLEPPGELDASRARIWNHRAAFWSAMMLATGLDYARSARLGELDMLLPPLVTGSIWMVFRAWRRHLESARTDWMSCILAAVAASLAGMSKGPPALAMIAVGAYGGILLHASRSQGPLRLEPQIPFLSTGRGDAVSTDPPSTRATWIGVIAGVGVALAFSVPQVEDARDAVGCASGAAMAGLVLGAIAPLFSVARLRAAFAALSRTHSILVLGMAMLVLWVWIQAVTARIDPSLLDVWAGEEVGDNLRPFRPKSPISIIEAASFGVGLGSVAFVATLVWLVRAGPRLRPGWFMLLAWSIGGLVMFSLFGKGLARYVLPVWPAMAMLGGIGVAEVLRVGTDRARSWVRGVLVSATIALTIGFGAWYGYGRAALYSHRSPRAFMSALLDPALGVDPRRVVTFELYDPGIAYYLDVLTAEADHQIDASRTGPPRPQPVGDSRTRFGLTGMQPWPLERLRRSVQRDGACVLIVRERRVGNLAGLGSPVDRLAEAGFDVTLLPIKPEYRMDGGRSRVIAMRLEVMSSAGP